MKDNTIANITTDYSINQLYELSKKNIPQHYSTEIINKLNTLESSNNIEEALSIKANYPKGEQINTNNTISIDIMNPKNEKTKNRKIIPGDIQSIDDEDKIKKNKNKKSPLQEYFQNGYKKYPHAKNSRFLIQHYNSWEGNNYFPYGGHIIEGPCSFRPTMATGLAMSLPVGLFIGFNANYIIEHWSIAVLLISGILGLLVLFFLIMSSFRDPGILRRYHYSGFYMNQRKNSKIFHLGFIRQYKYCGTCSIMRPLRSSHCFDCNNCVEKCDHHCPWIGNCVGKRNYLFFFLFVLFLTFSILFMEAFCIAHIWKYLHDSIEENNLKRNKNKRKNIVAYSLCDVLMSLYLIFYGVVCLAFSLGLLFYHISLVINNATTKEMLKFLWKNPFGNAYNRNLEYNMSNSLFPLVKKYSILDILRNGKSKNFERNEIERTLIQLQFMNINSDTNNALNNTNIDNNNDDIINNNNNNKFMNLSLNKKKVINIDPNQDVHDIFCMRNNTTNNYMELNDTTIN